jgi:hypothetical protein
MSWRHNLAAFWRDFKTSTKRNKIFGKTPKSMEVWKDVSIGIIFERIIYIFDTGVIAFTLVKQKMNPSRNM